MGDHIRKRRLDLALFQKDVAKKLHTDEFSIHNWETHEHEPAIIFYPAIMDFLGYCPIQYPKTLGDKLELYRTHQGLTFTKMAEMLDVDSGSLSKQIREKEPTEYYQQKFELFLDGLKSNQKTERIIDRIKNIKDPKTPNQPKTLGDHILKKEIGPKAFSTSCS